MHLSSGDIKLYIDSAIPNRLLSRYLTHFFDVTCIQKSWALHNFWLVLGMWKHIKMSGLVRKLCHIHRKAGWNISAKNAEILSKPGFGFCTFILNLAEFQTQREVTCHSAHHWNERTWVCSIFVTVSCLSRWAEGQGPGSWTPATGEIKYILSAFGWKLPRANNPRASLRPNPKRCVSTGMMRSFRGSAQLQGEEKRSCWVGILWFNGVIAVRISLSGVRGAGCVHCSWLMECWLFTQSWPCWSTSGLLAAPGQESCRRIYLLYGQASSL